MAGYIAAILAGFMAGVVTTSVISGLRRRDEQAVIPATAPPDVAPPDAARSDVIPATALPDAASPEVIPAVIPHGMAHRDAATHQLEDTTGERLLSTGNGPGTVEVPIDWPEPGRPAVVEVICTGEGEFSMNPFIRTGDRLKHFNDLMFTSVESYRGRHYLETEATHLRLEVKGQRQWSIRIKPLAEALPLENEHNGEGNEVLAYNGGPALLTVQVQSEYCWRVRFRCLCKKGGDCRCQWLAEFDTLPGERWSVSGCNDDTVTLKIPQAGWIVTQSGHDAMWSLRVAPLSAIQ